MRIRILLLLGAFLLFTVPAGAFDLKIATVAPDGSGWMKAMRKGGTRFVSAPTAGSTSSSTPAG